MIGWPIEHSRSPLIHCHWLSKLDLRGSYEKIAVAPDQLPFFVSSMKENGFVGGNVTIPHKEAMLRLVDKTNEAAEKIGAVNTIWFEDGKLVGGNTDWLGFLENLDQIAPGWDTIRNKETRIKTKSDKHIKTAMVIGAGGASRAIVYGLIQRGFNKVYLVNRTFVKALKLASDFGARILPLTFAEISKIIPDIDILVNTTSIGMSSKEALPDQVKDLVAVLPDHTIVHDIVYIPIETELLRIAKNRQLKTVDGLGMLLHQAVPGFNKWFGVRPVVTEELRQIIIRDIEASQEARSS